MYVCVIPSFDKIELAVLGIVVGVSDVLNDGFLRRKLILKFFLVLESIGLGVVDVVVVILFVKPIIYKKNSSISSQKVVCQK